MSYLDLAAARRRQVAPPTRKAEAPRQESRGVFVDWFLEGDPREENDTVVVRVSDVLQMTGCDLQVFPSATKAKAFLEKVAPAIIATRVDLGNGITIFRIPASFTGRHPEDGVLGVEKAMKQIFDGEAFVSLPKGVFFKEELVAAGVAAG